VERNVKNFGATGNGQTDDTQAIITALTQGRGDAPNSVYPNAQYSSSTQKPAYVFFPPGTYLVTQTLPVVYYTQMVGDPANPPTIKFVSNQGVRVLEVAGGWYTGANQDNFYRQIRNFVIDMTECNQCTGVHWQVAQATSITNVYFKSKPGSQAQGMWMENGSGGFFSDLVFEGGLYGIWVGNQQFTSRNITIRDVSVAAVYLNWDWVWTFKGLHIDNAPVGVDIASGTGSAVIIDSDFTATPIAVRTQFGQASGEGSLYLDNIKYAQSGTIVQNGGSPVLTANGATTVHSWAQGHIWQNGGNILGSKDISSLTPARVPSLLGSDGTYFEMTRPNYVGMTQVDVTTLGLVGDGNTDNSKALQSALNTYANKAVLFFPHGIYNIMNTVIVPPGSRLVGQVWSVLAATGPNFQNANSPIPMLQVGTPGQTGVAQLVDFIISTKGPVPGCKLVVWNMHDPANAPGSNGLWDVHYRIGGAIGTNIQPGNCPSGDGSNAPASVCNGAYIALHVTYGANLYMENVWGWAADHDIDQGSQINVYNYRGLLVESQGPMWLYGTAMEHHVYYQYNFNNAKNIFMGAIQTETPYYQPSKNTPFSPGNDHADPAFCNNDQRCAMAYGLVINNSTDLWIYSTGLYSFFNVWNQACLTGQPSCQIDMIKITNSKAIHAYALSTYGSLYILTSNQSYSQASANTNTFCATGIVDLNFF
jgi:glucan 1,3-beta-glucosidase